MPPFCIMPQDRKFVVAYASLHNGEITQKVVYAPDAYSALCDYFGTKPSGVRTVDDFYEWAYDLDSFVNILEI